MGFSSRRSENGFISSYLVKRNGGPPCSEPLSIIFCPQGEAFARKSRSASALNITLRRRCRNYHIGSPAPERQLTVRATVCSHHDAGNRPLSPFSWLEPVSAYTDPMGRQEKVRPRTAGTVGGVAGKAVSTCSVVRHTRSQIPPTTHSSCDPRLAWFALVTIFSIPPKWQEARPPGRAPGTLTPTRAHPRSGARPARSTSRLGTGLAFSLSQGFTRRHRLYQVVARAVRAPSHRDAR